MTSHDPLEQFVHQTLRSVPERRAPRSLEARILAAVAKKQVLPWYRQSFAQWPAPARFLFLILSATVAALVFRLGYDVLRLGVEPGLAKGSQHVHGLVGAIMSTGRALLSLFPHSMMKWLALAGGVVVSSYIILFGLGTAAYRYLVKSR